MSISTCFGCCESRPSTPTATPTSPPPLSPTLNLSRSNVVTAEFLVPNPSPASRQTNEETPLTPSPNNNSPSVVSNIGQAAIIQGTMAQPATGEQLASWWRGMIEQIELARQAAVDRYIDELQASEQQAEENPTAPPHLNLDGNLEP